MRWSAAADGCRRISAPSVIIAIVFSAFAKATAAQGRSRSTFGCDLHATRVPPQL